MRSLLLLFVSSLAIAAASVRADVDIPVSARCTEVLANSVTDKIYARCGANLIEIDAATHGQRSLPLAVPLRTIDPVGNRVIAASSAFNGSIRVVDVATWTVTTQSIPFLGDIAIDPVEGTLWMTRGTSPTGEIVRLDLATGATAAVPLPFVPRGVAIDPASQLVYASYGARSLIEIDPVSLATRSADLPSNIVAVYGIAVDPLRRTLYVSAFREGPDPELSPPVPETVVVDADSLARISSLVDPLAEILEFRPILGIDPGFDRLWIEYPDAWLDGVAANLSVFDLSTLQPLWMGDLPAINAGGSGFSVSPATGRAYLTSYFMEETAGLSERDASPVGPPIFHEWSPFDDAGNSAALLSTNRVYLSLSYYNGPYFVREHDEVESAPIPLPVAISADMPQPDGSVAVHFEATSGYPSPLPIRQIYYQVDSVEGAWTAASPSGASASATIALAPGPHVVHAFAMDGQEFAVSCSFCRNPVTGPVASLALDVSEPPVCTNGLDDDGDTFADFPADPGCRNAASVREDPQCDNGVDDDGDLAIDHPADALCRARWDNDESANPPGGCGLGAELVIALAAFARRRPQPRRWRPANVRPAMPSETSARVPGSGIGSE